MINNKDFENYFYKKLLNSILFNCMTYFEFVNGKYDRFILDYKFVCLCAEYAEEHIKNNQLESLQRGRLYTILLMVRNTLYFNQTKLKNHYRNIYNDLICSLNYCNDTNVNEIYQSEIDKRINCNLRFCTRGKKEKIKALVKDSMGLDFKVLNYLISDIDDEKLENEILRNRHFLISLNVILDEFPTLLKNPKFVSRIKKLILRNEIEELSKDKVKKILKKI